jgi:PTH2 family peptidyl-tRNA hydrolase
MKEEEIIPDHSAQESARSQAGRVKQVILIRRDLKMRRGKEIAQGSHASMAFLVDPLRSQLLEQKRAGLDDPSSTSQLETVLRVSFDPVTQKWIEFGMAKICLQVQSEDELLLYIEKARLQGLKCHLIYDSGKTEFHGERTLTAAAIGPNLSTEIDSVTSALSIY